MLRSIRFLLTTAAIFIAAGAAHSEVTVKDIIRNMPDSIIAPLSRPTLSELIEYYEAGQPDKKLANLLNGEAQIVTLDSVHAVIRTGDVRTLTINVLRAKSNSVVAVIETLETPIKDSRLTVYDMHWQTQPKLWKEPSHKNWLNDYGKKNRTQFEQDVPYILAEYTYNAATGILTLTNRNIENKYMLDELYYKWTPSGFKLIKK